MAEWVALKKPSSEQVNRIIHSPLPETSPQRCAYQVGPLPGPPICIIPSGAEKPLPSLEGNHHNSKDSFDGSWRCIARRIASGAHANLSGGSKVITCRSPDHVDVSA